SEFAKSLGVELIIGKLSEDVGIKTVVENSSGAYKTESGEMLGANLHNAAKAAPFLLELSKKQPPEAPEWPNKCGDCGTSRPSVKPLYFTIDPGAGDAYDKAVRVAMGYRVNEISRKMPIPTTDKIPAAETEKVDTAIPQ